jgi:hypothetical protein
MQLINKIINYYNSESYYKFKFKNKIENILYFFVFRKDIKHFCYI